MTAVFSEVYRVLKDDGLSTVVFHSAHSRIWRALTEAFGEARLRVRRTSILDKIQASFKQVVSTVSVKGDPLILLEKGLAAGKWQPSGEVFRRLKRDFEGNESPDVREYFSRYAAECIAAGEPVAFDAAAFAERIALPASS